MVKNNVVKKTVYDKLVDTSGFALKIKYDTDKKFLILVDLLQKQIVPSVI